MKQVSFDKFVEITSWYWGAALQQVNVKLSRQFPLYVLTSAQGETLLGKQSPLILVDEPETTSTQVETLLQEVLQCKT